MKRLIIPITISTCTLVSHAGDLNPPPGPIQPTDRVQLNAQAITLPHTITQAGSYVLTSNLAGVAGEHGIIIDADNVTLDLNGFALIGVPDSLHGISSNRANIRITNGTVRGWGADGINLGGTNIQLDHLRAADNGNDGIFVIGSATMTSCSAYLNGGEGLQLGTNGTVDDCTARRNSGTGISTGNAASVTNCSARFNSVHGISTAIGSTITGCGSYDNDQVGITGAFGATITDCASASNVLAGIRVGGDSLVSNNNCHNNGAGILVSAGNSSRIDSNNVTGNTIGIDIDQVNNIIIRNTAGGNTTNYDITTGNAFGQIINVAATGSFSSTDPWANFEY